METQLVMVSPLWVHSLMSLTCSDHWSTALKPLEYRFKYECSMVKTHNVDTVLSSYLADNFFLWHSSTTNIQSGDSCSRSAEHTSSEYRSTWPETSGAFSFFGSIFLVSGVSDYPKADKYYPERTVPGLISLLSTAVCVAVRVGTGWYGMVQGGTVILTWPHGPGVAWYNPAWPERPSTAASKSNAWKTSWGQGRPALRHTET